MGYRKVAVRVLESRNWALVEPQVMLIEGVTQTSIKSGSRLYDAVAEARLEMLTRHKFEAWDEGSLAAFPLDPAPREPAVAASLTSTSPTSTSPTGPSR